MNNIRALMAANSLPPLRKELSGCVAPTVVESRTQQMPEGISS